MVKQYFILFSILIFLLGCGSSKETVTKPDQKEIEIIPEVKEKPIQKNWDSNQISDYISFQSQGITSCYQTIKNKNSSVGGKLLIRFKILTNGSVDSFTVVQNSVKNPELEKCVKSIVISWKFDAVESSNKPVWLEVPYDFTDFKNENETNRSEEEIGQVISRNRNQLSLCFTDYYSAVNVNIDFDILPNGKVRNVIITNSDISNADVEDCLIKQISSWVFNPIQGEKIQQISFPYIYSR